MKLRERTTAILLIAIFMISTLAVAIPVSATDVQPGTGTLEAAITNAQGGDTLTLAPGTYNEGIIVINKDLTIVGYPSKPVIKPTADTGSSDANWGWFTVGIGVTVTFENLVFDGTGKAIHAAVYYFRDSGTGNQALGGSVKNCDFKNIIQHQYMGRGIINYGEYVEVLECTFANIQRIGIYTGHGESLIKGCTYTGKGAGDWLDYGFEIGRGGNAIIENNIVTDCYGEGSGWSSAGIYVHEAHGILGTSATITGNTISGSNYGIVVGYAYKPWATSTVVAHYNNIAGNDCGVKSVGLQVPEVDARFNWWGHASGPGGQYGRITKSDKIIGQGDSVSENVLWDPWLPQPVLHTQHDPVPPGLLE